jgi:tellurite resistance protein TerC
LITSTEWIFTIAFLATIFSFDLAFAIARRNRLTSLREAGFWTTLNICLAISFGIFLPHWANLELQKQFFAGWLTEYALSVDNIFVFIILLANLKVQREKQQLVLLLGILLTVSIRALLIPLGATAISRFSSIFYIFGIFLIYTAWKLWNENEEVEYEETRVIAILKKRGFGTFAIALIALGLADFVFSLDSIPAIFGLTKSAYIVTTANVFALMGLRHLYFLLEGLLNRLVYLSRGLSFILAFIGVKMILEALIGSGVEVPEVSLEISLGVIISTLAITAITSLAATRKVNKDPL